MELILIRHGKAQERSAAMEDANRALTDNGKNNLLKSLPNLKLLIKNLDEAHIWSSRFTRAAQTAELISKIFNIQNIEYFDFISDGNFDVLNESLTKIKPSGTVLIVGHEPHLSIWSQQLVGLTLPFKKGAAAGFRIDADHPQNAELLWFFQPRALSRL